LSSNFESILRRLKPEKRRGALVPRAKDELPFWGKLAKPPRKLLYDTTVYIDVLQGKFPQSYELLLRATDAWHSTVTAAELAAPCGRLDPLHPATASVVKQILAVLEARPQYRTISPDREIWFEAGVLSGVLSRLQQYAAVDRRRVLNDALLFSTARKHGLAVLTRNIKDFDLLQQIDPSGQVLFYEATD
jgi:predicted nucleic acid-binding protein